MRPLMEFLISFGAFIVILSNIAHISNYNRLHPILVKGGDQAGCLLVFDIFDLVFEFPELFLLGTNKLLTSTGAFLLPIDLL